MKIEHTELEKLVESWNRQAMLAFISAEKEPNPMGRRLIEHGAFCYFNAATQLHGLLIVNAESPIPEDPRR